VSTASVGGGLVPLTRGESVKNIPKMGRGEKAISPVSDTFPRCQVAILERPRATPISQAGVGSSSERGLLTEKKKLRPHPD